MANSPFSTLQLSNQLFLSPPPLKSQPPSSITTRATPEESSTTNTDTADATESSDDFEKRLIRVRNKSGTGKKAELRKSRKRSGSSSAATVFLPPVPLKEPISKGLKVEYGFTPYSERMNGRVALLGLSALLLVELATGQSVIKFHSPEIVFTQIYFVAAATAIYSKFEKERISKWP